MVAEQITVWGIAILVAFLIPVFISNILLGLSINKSMVVGISRMIVQLILVGIYLQFLFKWNYWWLNVIYIGIMVAVSAITVINSCKLKHSKFFILLFAGIGAPLFVVIFLLTIVVLRLDNFFDARYLITMSGMLLGNCMRSIIISFNTFYNEIKNNEDTYLLYLSLGATKTQAVKPTIINAMESALKPAIASMATMGLVSLPGMMTGQMLGGSLPMTAISYQIIIMVAIFLVQYTGISVMLRIAANISFTKRDMLRKDIFQ